jgi:hypothetical protein
MSSTAFSQACQQRGWARGAALRSILDSGKFSNVVAEDDLTGGLLDRVVAWLLQQPPKATARIIYNSGSVYVDCDPLVAEVLRHRAAYSDDRLRFFLRLARGDAKRSFALDRAFQRMCERGRAKITVVEDWCDLLGTHPVILYGAADWDAVVREADAERHGTELRYLRGCPCRRCVVNHSARTTRARRRASAATATAVA